MILSRNWGISLYAVILLVLGAGCKSSQWSDEKRKAFNDECMQQTTFSSLRVQFCGFDDRDFTSVTVKEYAGGRQLDSFAVPVPPMRDQWDKKNKVRAATISRRFHLSRTYVFIIPGQRPFTLANMKMVLWPQFTMASEGWGCVMGEFTIDGARFQKEQSPAFIKR